MPNEIGNCTDARPGSLGPCGLSLALFMQKSVLIKVKRRLEDDPADVLCHQDGVSGRQMLFKLIMKSDDNFDRKRCEDSLDKTVLDSDFLKEQDIGSFKILKEQDQETVAGLRLEKQNDEIDSSKRRKMIVTATVVRSNFEDLALDCSSTTHIGSDAFVYDYYLSSNSPANFTSEQDEWGIVHFENGQNLWQLQSDQSDQDSFDEEDSNAEDYYANDYPDEESDYSVEGISYFNDSLEEDYSDDSFY